MLRKIAYFVTAFALVFLATMVYSCLTEHADMEQQCNALRTQYAEQTARTAEYIQMYNDLATEYKELKSEYTDLARGYTVAVVSNGHNYHRLGCHYIAGRTITIYEKSMAIISGYEPCYDCYNEDVYS